VLRNLPLAPDQVLWPVIDTVTNYIETRGGRPAERIAEAVGDLARVLAGIDCGLIRRRVWARV
jgi:hypothetical protein